jgi:hypothetical protein
MKALLKKGSFTMMTPRHWFGAAAVALALAATQSPNTLSAQTPFSTAVAATHPIAYYPLSTTSGHSMAGTSSYSPKGGVTVESPGAGIVGAKGAASSANSKDSYLSFNGKDGYVLTTQKGGVGESASLMTWVNLAALPSKDQHFLYVAGESEYGNDLDLQFETDDMLKFFTAAGGHVEYRPPADSLLHQWHMIVVTLDTATRTRAIYWDGKLVAHDQGGGKAGKTAALSIGASTVFGGRWFDGGIEQVALWNRALKSTEVSALYTASGVHGTTGK